MKKILFYSAFILCLVSSSFLLVGKTKAEDNKLPESVKSCLTGKIGAAALEEIMSGTREPSDDEKEKGKACFSDLFQTKENVKVKQTVKACIKNAIGKEINEISEPTAEQAQKIEACFGGAKNGIFSFPAETKSCIVSLVGKTRADEIMSGKEPNDTEKNKIGPKCFGIKGGPGGQGGPKGDLPKEVQACIQSTLGKPLSQLGPLNEQQRSQIDQKCFGGQEREKSKERMTQMSDTEKSCLQNLFGKPIDQMGPLTADQEKSAAQCFQNTSSNQTAEESVRRSSGFTDEQKSCLNNIFGRAIQDMEELNSDQQRQAGQCFGQAGSQNNDNTAGAGSTESGNTETSQSNSTEVPGGISALKTETQQCIAERLGLTVGTLGNANYNDPNVESIVMTCKDLNNEE